VASRGEYDRALESYERQLRISEELGDRLSIANAIGNMGLLYYRRGEYDRALESYERQLCISEEVGDRNGIARAIGNVGGVYGDRGEYDRALQNVERQLRISEELGDRVGTARAIGNMGVVYYRLGDYDRALGSLCRAEEEHRVIGVRDGLSAVLPQIASVLLEVVATLEEMPEYLPTYVPGATPGTPVRRGEWQGMALRRARECAEECTAISVELSKPDQQFSGRVVLARIEGAEGNVEGAIEQLGVLLAEAVDDAQRADCWYWLWKLGAPGHANQALTLYERLYATTPDNDYRKRIAELSATIPSTSDTR